MLEIKSLYFSYDKPENGYVLKNIDFAIDKEDSLALIGANGSGKTTLFLMLTGLYKFKGDIIIDKLNLKKYDEKVLRKKIGIIFQNADEQLFMPTVYDELKLSLAQHYGFLDESKIDYYLKCFNIESLKFRKIENLSAGEKKKVALVSILIYSPDILLLDEPTAFLDLKGCSELIRIINEQKITKIISTHNYFFAKECCNKALLLKKGEICAFDELDKIISDKELLSKAEII
ncbi:ABC transporter ATP-binding protein [Candidatus Dependentiae bacterium]|nr:ABC transporter ATP-binding protein [Candidatus Dependentiae bacterium]